ncbi:2OG-Fe dioxygenase family protein [Streptomyces sp. NPDC056682]|uniref:2OG-Fe dioxygenase family protein n=1 Tax=Streptomyces sp. NPDC056682 TaxID=3345909 RepID=UPI00369E161D
MHQHRTRAELGRPGPLTPEGVHHDGHEFVMIGVLDRQRVGGGETRLWRPAPTRTRHPAKTEPVVGAGRDRRLPCPARQPSARPPPHARRTPPAWWGLSSGSRAFWAAWSGARAPCPLAVARSGAHRDNFHRRLLTVRSAGDDGSRPGHALGAA